MTFHDTGGPAPAHHLAPGDPTESAAPASPCDAWELGGDWTPNAEMLAALADAEAGRTTPVTLDELRAEILADDEDTDGGAA